MTVYIINDICNNETITVGVCSSFKKLKEKIIKIMGRELLMDKEDYNYEVENIKKAITIEELNDQLEDVYCITKLKINK